MLQKATAEVTLVPMDAREFKLFRTLIHRETGIWLRDNKHVMLASRLSRRLRLHRMGNFADYYAYLDSVQDGGEELGELINCVTTNKTSFFREGHHFDYLAKTIVPGIQQAWSQGSLHRQKTIRVWSAACSTGEEPYSIAMTLLAEVPGSSEWDIRIVASDIDTAVLGTAARGTYSVDALESVAPPLRSRYFLRGKGEMQGQIRVKKEVIQRIEFKRINLMDKIWSVEGPFDAIFFRNALIYFNQDTQESFLRRMLRYLKPKGHLFLGHAEHVPWLHDAVDPLRQTIYQLRDKPR